MTVQRTRRRWAGAVLLAAALAGVVAENRTRADETADAPTADPGAVPVTYIGELKGAPESARIAVVIEGDKFVAYVCSADKAFNNACSRWYRGDVTGGKLAAKADGGAAVAATAAAGAVTGTLSVGGKAHEFTAKAVAGDADAGLFRAADKLGDDDVVFGWIADEKGEIVGTAGKKGGPVQTLPAPKAGANVAGKLDGQKVPAGKVGGAANTPAASPPGRKFDAAARAEFLADLVAQRKAEGGCAVQALVLHQTRRFVAGKKPETKLEEKVFAALQKAPKGSLTDYVKDWDKLPLATREALLGPAARQLDPNKGLDAAQARKLVREMPVLANIRPGKSGAAPASGTVKGVNITTVKCVSETLPKAFGQDEVFALHAVLAGSSGPAFKQTAVLREFDDGVTQLFPAADKGVFPLPGLSPAAGAEVTVVTTLFEDDGAVLVGVLNLLKPLIEAVAVIVLEQVADAKDVPLDEAAKEALRAGVKGVIDGAVASTASLLVRPLGSDLIVVRPNGTVVGSNGAAKAKMVFKRVKNGDVKHNYELFGFDVQK